MKIDGDSLKKFLESRRDKVIEMLCDVIAIPSTRGGEGPVNRYLADRLKGMADVCELVPVPEDIVEDEDYCFPIEGLTYADRPNLNVVKRGKGTGRSLVFNTHVDVVPPSPGQVKAFDPEVRDGAIYGRGACDAKGQAITMALVLEALNEFGPAGGDVNFHFVIEEECGGNGSLAMVRRGCQADGAVVMEPSDLNIFPSVRGALWFDVTCYGRSGHSGRAGDVVSALKKAIQAMDILEDYHERLLAESRQVPFFEEYANPMPITFGQLEAGDWPAMAPNRARFKGVFGFLPNKSRREVEAQMREAIITRGDEWLRENFDMDFIYSHDGNYIPEDHPLVQTMLGATRASGYEAKLTGMTASCDAWLYNNQLAIPTVVYGPGTLGYAHSVEEHILIDDILKATEVLVKFIANWCED
jgi:acetylornithine deacetylase